MHRFTRYFLVLLLSISAFLVQAAPPQEGVQYRVINPAVPVAQPGKIEVVELFWYGCGHCYQFESTLNPWVKQLPNDVHFVKIPAMLGGAWDIHGQLFLTLESMNVDPAIHTAVFQAIHEEGNMLETPEKMATFLTTKGIDQAAFLQAFNSFAIKAQVEKNKQLVKIYKVLGVPAMIVNGTYQFDLGSAGGPGQALVVADQLIQKVRTAL